MAEKGKGKGGVASFAVVLLLLTLVGAGAGFAVGSLLQGAPAASDATAKAEAPAKPEAGGEAAGEAPAEGETAPAAEEEATDIAGMKVVPFPPVLTTLAEPRGKWIRLEGSILTRAETEDPPELLAEKSGEQILVYLRTLSLEQIEGPSGLLALREDLTETVRVLSNEQVQGVLIHGLIVE